MPMPILSGRTASCLGALVCSLAALTFAARAQSPAASAAAHPSSSATCPRPDYPKDAMQAHWTGVSTIAFLVGADGNVRDAKILKSSGHESLDTAALTTLGACPFKPTVKNGHPVESWQPVQFAWTLQ